MIGLLDLWNKCDVCGKFIPFRDIEDGIAVRKLLAPESWGQEDEYETLCRDHANEQKI